MCYLLGIASRRVLEGSQALPLILLTPSVQVGSEEALVVLSHGSKGCTPIEKVKFLIIFFVPGISLGRRSRCQRPCAWFACLCRLLRQDKPILTFHGLVIHDDLLAGLGSLWESDLGICESSPFFNFILLVLFKLGATRFSDLLNNFRSLQFLMTLLGMLEGRPRSSLWIES